MVTLAAPSLFISGDKRGGKARGAGDSGATTPGHPWDPHGAPREGLEQHPQRGKARWAMLGMDLFLNQFPNFLRASVSPAPCPGEGLEAEPSRAEQSPAGPARSQPGAGFLPAGRTRFHNDFFSVTNIF